MFSQQSNFHSESAKKTKGHGCPVVGMNTPLVSKEVWMILTGG
jgi:hypothetical protein